MRSFDTYYFKTKMLNLTLLESSRRKGADREWKDLLNCR